MPAQDSKTPETPAKTWTSRELLRWMTERFEAKEVDAPRIVAEMLLAHVLECDRMRLYMEVDRVASAAELTRLREFVRRASDHEPVQYLVGRASFFSREFLVEPSTMIPQPCTEDLVTAVLDGFGAEPPAAPLIADIGTGTGCIAISLALQLPSARLVATDVVPAALDLARRNAERHRVSDRIDFREGSLLEPLRAPEDDHEAPRFDVICSNPPYIPDDEWNDGRVQKSVREHVPESALRGGGDGLDLIRPLIAEAGSLLAGGGRLVLEIAHAQRDEVIALVEAAPDLARPRVLMDYERLWRVLVAEKS